MMVSKVACNFPAGVIIFFMVIAPLMSQLLRPDKMHIGKYNPKSKHYEKETDTDKVEKPTSDNDISSSIRWIGGDDHDYRAQEHLIDRDDPDHKTHEHLIGGDDHDYRYHGHLIGSDDHDYRYHGKLIGGDDHDYRAHRRPLGGGDHDYKEHKKAFGRGSHDYKKHKKAFGRGDHDYKEHKKAFGHGNHDYKEHKKAFGRGNHDYKEHKKAFGRGSHDKVNHKRAFGRGKHDLVPHLLPLGRGNHDYLPHNIKSKSLLTKFHRFTKKFRKFYESPHELKTRFKIFKDNFKKAKLLQSTERGTAKYGITKFSDLTAEEFKQMLGLRPDKKPAKSYLKPANLEGINKLSTVPSEFDWRSKGVVTPVKNQGMCGSCWAFSVTGNVEGQYAIKHDNLLSLSEQELIDCDDLDSGCNGGLPENAYHAIEELGGLETEKSYPYEGKNEECTIETNKVRVKVNGSVELPEDEEVLKKWLYKDGPISIGINANMLQFYVGGVSHPLKFLCNPKDLDHGVLIVGYGKHAYPIFNTTLPFWVIKNSWGADWGEQGYFRVYRGDGTCGVNLMATSSEVL